MINPSNRNNVSVTVDNEDEWVTRFKWRIDESGYVVTTYGRRSYGLHNAIVRPKFFEVVDHINGNKLNNRRVNLRITDKLGNAWNRKAVNKTSPFKGVSFCKTHKKWLSKITCDKVSYSLGSFKDEYGAALAYDVAARELYGPFAWLNFHPRRRWND